MESEDLYKQALELETSGGDPSKIVSLLEDSASKGCSDATYALATFYLHGKYLNPDPALAFYYLQLAAKGLHPSALFDLGNAFETGDICAKNEEAAFQSYLTAAIFGDREAINEVARCFYYGIGTRKDKRMYLIFSDIYQDYRNHLRLDEDSV